MEFLTQMGIVIEVIAMNMTIYYINSHLRYSLSLTISVIFMYSLLLIAVFYAILTQFSFYGNGNGFFTIVGFLYLLPLHFLFDDRDSHNFYVICYAWVYTLVIFSISVQIGYLLEGLANRFLITWIVQSILFVSTSSKALQFMKTYYMKLMQHHDNKIRQYVNRCTLLWFLTILAINMNFIFPSIPCLSIIAFIFILWNVMYSYMLIHEILKRHETIDQMVVKINHDALTHVGSRSGLYQKVENLIKEQRPFVLIYMDLDTFKNINDTHGHVMGDRYLVRFAQEVKKCCAERDHVYRISGDEFVMIHESEHADSLIKKIKGIDFVLEKQKIHFRGVSIGYAAYPNEAHGMDSLIHLADQRMYAYKRLRYQKQ